MLGSAALCLLALVAARPAEAARVVAERTFGFENVAIGAPATYDIKVVLEGGETLMTDAVVVIDVPGIGSYTTATAFPAPAAMPPDFFDFADAQIVGSTAQFVVLSFIGTPGPEIIVGTLVLESTPGGTGGLAPLELDFGSSQINDAFVLGILPISNPDEELADVVILPGTDCDVVGPLTNCGFESGDFTGWILTDISGASFPAIVDFAGTTNPAFPTFSSAPSEGSRVALHGFDGSGPGTIRLEQEVAIPSGALELRFDWRAAWDLFNACAGCALPRHFRVDIEPSGGGTPLASRRIFWATPLTLQNDTGPQLGQVDVSPYAGQTVRVAFVWDVPEVLTGPAFFQLDNVRVYVASGGPDGDFDGLTDAEEVIFLTDPGNADSDGDGLVDGSEAHVTFTDPSSDDTDGDFLLDGYELGVTATDPTLADTDGNKRNDTYEDPDGDFLGSAIEAVLGLSPLVQDTDGDGHDDNEDNCPLDFNPIQGDADLDSRGDPCDDGDPADLTDTTVRAIRVEVSLSQDLTVVGAAPGVTTTYGTPLQGILSVTGSNATITLPGESVLAGSRLTTQGGTLIVDGTVSDFVIEIDNTTGQILAADWAFDVDSPPFLPQTPVIHTAHAAPPEAGFLVGTLGLAPNQLLFCTTEPGCLVLPAVNYDPVTGRAHAVGRMDIPLLDGLPPPNDLYSGIIDIRLSETYARVNASPTSATTWDVSFESNTPVDTARFGMVGGTDFTFNPFVVDGVDVVGTEFDGALFGFPGEYYVQIVSNEPTVPNPGAPQVLGSVDGPLGPPGSPGFFTTAGLPIVFGPSEPFSSNGSLVPTTFSVDDPLSQISVLTTGVDDSCIVGGDGDGFAEPSEVVLIEPTLFQAAGTSATNVSATLASLTPGVVVLDANATYPDLLPIQPTLPTTPFRIHVQQSVTCGSCPPIDTPIYAINASSGMLETFDFSSPVPSNSVPLPFDFPTGIDGLTVVSPVQAFWVNGLGSGFIVEFDPTTGVETLGAFPAPLPSAPLGIGGLATLDPFTGVAADVFALQLITFDLFSGIEFFWAPFFGVDALGGGDFRLFGSDGATLFELDPFSGIPINFMPLPDLDGDLNPEVPTGLAFDGTHLFMTNSAQVGALDPNTGALLAVSPFVAPGFLSGLGAVTEPPGPVCSPGAGTTADLELTVTTDQGVFVVPFSVEIGPPLPGGCSTPNNDGDDFGDCADLDDDNDNLTDIEETSTYLTNPLLYDTDSDGLGDGDEVALGTDPLDDDTDDDLDLDGADNCPFVPNPDQLNGDSHPAGNLCQCGDVNGDGVFDVLDIVAYQQNLVGLAPLPGPGRCHVNPLSVPCGVGDIFSARQFLLGILSAVDMVCPDYGGP